MFREREAVVIYSWLPCFSNPTAMIDDSEKLEIDKPVVKCRLFELKVLGNVWLWAEVYNLFANFVCGW